MKHDIIQLDAEWVALSEALKEIMFMIQLLRSMKISINLPVMVRFDNMGAIFMAINITNTSNTKCVDTRYKYVNEYVEDGIVKIIFDESAETDCIILTKNLSPELHQMHSKKW